MRRLVAAMFITADGVFESPEDWNFQYWSDEMDAAIMSQVTRSDALLLGRKTYQDFAPVWPAMDHPIAPFMNDTPKYVASTTLTSAAWKNTTIMDGDLPSRVRELKGSTGQDILINGSATLVRALMNEGLIDEVQLLVHPLIRGHGGHLFTQESRPQAMRLNSSAVFSTGVLHVSYEPAAQLDPGVAGTSRQLDHTQTWL